MIIKNKLLYVSLAAACSLYAALAQAAVTPNSIVTAQIPNRGILQFTSISTPSNYLTLYSAGQNGSKCFGLYTTNNDASQTHLLTVQIVNSAVKFGGASVTTVVNAGFANAAPPQVITGNSQVGPGVWAGLPLDNVGNYYIELNAGDTLQATFATSITSSSVVNLVVTCSDY